MKDKDKETSIEEGERRWPNIMKAIQPGIIMPHLSRWCTTNKPEGPESMKAMREEIVRFLKEKLAHIPLDEAVDALSERMSSDIMKNLCEQNNKRQAKQAAQTIEQKAKSSQPPITLN